MANTLFEIGDIVELKSGSIELTVLKIENGIVDVVYFWDGKFIKHQLDQKLLDRKQL